MVTTLYLVRHGETEGSEVKRYKGSIDVPLSERIGQIKVRVYKAIREHICFKISELFKRHPHIS
jgi:broad specificity phosphatase PhoE